MTHTTPHEGRKWMSELFDSLGPLPEQAKPQRAIDPLSATDFTLDEDGIKRIDDWRLAELLGFGKQQPENAIRKLTERHHATLELRGTLRHRVLKSTGGRPATAYRYNIHQALYLVIKSDADNATPLQLHMIDIYVLVRSGEIMPANAEAELKLADINAEFVEASPELAKSLVGLRDPLEKLIEEMPALLRDVKKINRNMQRRQRAHDSGFAKLLARVLTG